MAHNEQESILEWFTVKELADRLGYSERTIRRWVRSLPEGLVFKAPGRNGQYRIHRDVLKAHRKQPL